MADPDRQDIVHRSIWEATSQDAPTFPRYEGKSSTDVLIIGGGISGITAALHLSRAGIKVIVLEAQHIGLGTTGHSTGNLYVHTDKHLSKLLKVYGTDIVKEVLRSRASAIDFIESTVKEQGLACNFNRVPFHHYMEDRNAKNQKFLESEHQAALKCGLNAELLPEAPLPFSTQGALRWNNQAQFHPLNYVRGLAEHIAPSCQIFEKSPALEIDSKSGLVKVPGGEIQAQYIIVATHTPKGASLVQFALSPVREFGFAAEMKDSTFKPGIYWSIDQPKHSLRSLDISEKKYLIAIGEKHKTGHAPPSPQPIHSLEAYLSKRFTLGDTQVSWAAQAYQSADFLPFIGRSQGRAFYLTGFSTDGLVYGTMGAGIISDQILGKSNPWADLYKLKRFRPLKSAGILVKEAADVFGHYLRDIPGVGTCKLEDIKTGEGGIIDRKGEKIAVFKKDEKTYQCVSAVCTHMKCIVKFNSINQSWDCPCHASRFDLKGRVIEGPALKDLEGRTL